VLAGELALTIVPLAPTDSHAPDTHASPSNALVVPDVCDAHELPPFVVATIVPLATTVQHNDVDTQAAAFN
jgi:hypothetical protein